MASQESPPPVADWPARAAVLLETPAIVLTAARSTGDAPCRGPVMLAIAADRLAVVAGVREDPASAGASVVVHFVDLLLAPDVRPSRRRRGPSVSMRTANSELHIEAPLITLQRLVDAYSEATAPAATPVTLPAPSSPAPRGLRADLAAPRRGPSAALAAPESSGRPAGYVLRDGVLSPEEA